MLSLSCRSPGRSSGRFPNPFRLETAVRLPIGRGETAVLEVFDLQGRRVRILDTGGPAAREREVIWRGDDAFGRPVPAGAYVLVLTTPSGTRRGKVIRLR